MTEPVPTAAPPQEPASTPALAAVRTAPERKVLGVVLLVLSLVFLFAPPFLIPHETYRLGIFSKYMALSILALSVDLVWGYTGLLSLGQGVYFSLGAYAVAYSLTLQSAAATTGLPPGKAPPQFMSYTNFAPNDPNYVEPPALAWIAPLSNIWVALAAAIIVPTLVAGLFGLVTFRLRIKGVYFALITQALLLAVFILVRNQQRITGGVVGIKDLEDLKLLGLTFNPYNHVRELYWLIAGGLTVCLLLCTWLVRTKFGKILTAIRDNENRVLALGYNTAMYKTFLFALAGGLAGLAGAFYVSANALAGPDYLSISFSIEAVVWVAVGGRGSLLGAVIGAVLVGFAQSYVSSAFPDYWTIALGLLFVLVVVFLPNGLIAPAGRGALLGTLIGVILAEPVVNLLGNGWTAMASSPTKMDLFKPAFNMVGESIPKPARVLLSCGFILLMVFMPRIVGRVSQMILARFRAGPESKIQVEA